jgi:hypothetical protein
MVRGIGYALVSIALTACGPKMEEKLVSDDDAVRAEAIEKVKTMSESSRADLVPPLMKQLDTTKKVAAPDKKEDLVPALAAQAESTLRGQTIRRRALAGLAAVGGPAVKPMADVLDDPNQRPWVRADVAQTFGEMGSVANDAQPALEHAFESSKDERLRIYSAVALVMMGRRDTSFVEALRTCAQTSPMRCEKERREVSADVIAKYSL